MTIIGLSAGSLSSSCAGHDGYQAVLAVIGGKDASMSIFPTIMRLRTSASSSSSLLSRLSGWTPFLVWCGLLGLASAQELQPGNATQLQIPSPAATQPELIPTPAGVDMPGFALQELTDIALANSPRLRRALADAEQARGEAVQAGMYPNPRFESGNPQQIGGAQSVYSGGITQQIVRGGKLKLSRAAAEQHFASLQMQYRAERLALITEVRKQFIAGLAQQMRLELLRSLLQVSHQSEQATENLLKAGEASTPDVLLIRVERRRAEAAVQSLEMLLAGQKRQMAYLVGVPDLTIDRFLGTLDFVIPQMDDEEFVRRVVSENPLVRAASFETGRSRFLVERAIAEPTPNLTVQSGGQYTVNQPRTQGLIGVYFDIPIWNRNQGGIRAAQADLSSAVAEVNNVQNDLARRLADALSRYRAAENQLAIIESGILPDTEESLQMVTNLYKNGRYDVLRLLQAQRSYFESRISHLEVLESRASAAAEVAGLLQLEVMP